MQPENLGLLCERELADVLDNLLVRRLAAHALVVARRRQPVLIVKDGHLVEVGEGAEEVAAVLVIRHATPVVALSYEVVERLELVLLVLVEHHLGLPDGNGHIPRGEFVRDVPPEGPEAAPLLHHGVEEAEGKGELCPLLVLLARREELLVGDGVGQEGALDIEADPLGGLVGHLDAVLQHRHGEDARRVRREPQAEGLVRRLRLELFAHALQLHHPAAVHVAVLQHHPVPRLVRLLDVLLRNRPLSLPQADNLHRLAEALFVRELVQRGVGVSAGREHKNEGGAGVGVLVAGRKVEGGRLDELLAHLLGDVEHDRGDELIGADAAHDEQAAEGVALAPLAGEVVRVGLGALEHVAPVLLEPLEVILEARGALEQRHPVDFAPRLLHQPRVAWVGLGLPQRHAAREKELDLVVGELALRAQQARAEEEGEDELVLLEERPADHLVQEVCEEALEQLQALRQVARGLRVLDGLDEETDEPGEGVLVHGLDGGEARDGKEEDR
mmetsp:Transcript_31441/g.79873  ORF Transcript_31441/g.79873 Transcript_31441/m.79873 type:complete len:501 (-) Transcript_31441:6606-8108(-)